MINENIATAEAALLKAVEDATKSQDPPIAVAPTSPVQPSLLETNMTAANIGRDKEKNA
jgi:hypothetical protein